MRPGKRQPRAGKGGRQTVWNCLRDGGTLSTAFLAQASGAAESSVRGYLRVLATHGYVAHDEAGWRLVKDTGPRAPSASVNEGALYDWNLCPPMPASELRALWQASGLSMRAFAIALGFTPTHATRVRAMIDGLRPISPQVEAAARALRAKLQAAPPPLYGGGRPVSE